jgi:hypothetical protein
MMPPSAGRKCCAMAALVVALFLQQMLSRGE